MKRALIVLLVLVATSVARAQVVPAGTTCARADDAATRTSMTMSARFM